MKDDSFIIEAVNSAKDSRKKSNEEIHLREIDIGLGFRKLLGEFTKKELQEIRRTWNFAGISQLNKAELIKAIAGRIEENLEKWLKLLNKEQFVNLKKVIKNNEKKKYQYNLSEEIDFELLGYYRKRGVVFSGRYNNKKVLIIPEDLLPIIKKAIDKPDVYNQIKRNDEIIEITRGFLIYYGVLPLTDLYNKIEKLVNIEMSPYEFKQLIKEYNKYDYGLECTGDYLCLSEVIDLESIYIEQYRRSDLNYYPLSLKTVKKAAWLGHEPWNLIQRRFKRYLIQEYNFPPDEAEYLLDICVYQIKNDKGSMELLEIIQNYIELPDMEEVRKLLNLLTELQNNTRQWVIKGHTPNELFQEEKKHFKPLPEKNNEYARHEQGTIVRIKEKVGRNDPCPCGSGKKYKKCCGRN